MAAVRVLVILLALTQPSLGWWDFWPYEEHQAMTSRSVDICAERYPDMAAEIASFRDELNAGSHDEDYDSDEINGSYCDYSGYCPAIPGAWWPTARRHLNAIQWVLDSLNPNNWSAAIATYTTSHSDAYYMLGHILHNLQDLFVPAHSHISPHGLGTSGLVENHSWPGYFDNFEQYCEVTENELNRARAGRIPEAALETLMVRAALFSGTDVESIGFQPSVYYADPDAPGGWGRYRPFPSGGYPCGRDRIDNDIANGWSLHLVPACCEYAAGAMRVFFLACNPTAIRQENPATSTLPARVPRLPSPLRPGSVLQALPSGFTIVDRNGRLVFRASDQTAVPRSLPSGVYFVRTLCAGRIRVQPVVVVSH